MSDDSEENGLAVPDSKELRLIPEAEPTYSYHDNKDYQDHVVVMHERFMATQEETFLGPYFRLNAPYRAKISPPHEPGKILVVKGRVWSHDERQPLRGARMDVWHANKNGKYDNEDTKNPPGENDFVNRARIYCDDNGYYEFETIHPGPYRRGETWRAPHIHFHVYRPGYATLVTQLFFAGDPRHKDDPFIMDSLVIKLRKKEHHGKKYDVGRFDMVLVKAVES